MRLAVQFNNHEDVLIIPEDEIEGKTQEEVWEVCDQYYNDWVQNYDTGGWEIID